MMTVGSPIAGAGMKVILNVRVSVAPALSLTFTLNVRVPAADGVP